MEVKRLLKKSVDKFLLTARQLCDWCTKFFAFYLADWFNSYVIIRWMTILCAELKFSLI